MAVIKMASRHRVRNVLAALLLACFLAIQTFSAIAETVHSHGPSHADCCAACHAGHLSVVQALRNINIAPPIVTGWRKPPDVAPLACECLTPWNSSRAPPA